MDKSQIIAKLQELAPTLQQLGVASAFLFGSRARGDETHASDIDVAVMALSETVLGPQEVLSIYGVLGDAFGYDIAIDVVVLPCRDAALNAAIAQDAELAFA